MSVAVRVLLALGIGTGLVCGGPLDLLERAPYLIPRSQDEERTLLVHVLENPEKRDAEGWSLSALSIPGRPGVVLDRIRRLRTGSSSDYWLLAETSEGAPQAWVPVCLDVPFAEVFTADTLKAVPGPREPREAWVRLAVGSAQRLVLYNTERRRKLAEMTVSAAEPRGSLTTSSWTSVGTIPKASSTYWSSPQAGKCCQPTSSRLAPEHLHTK